MPPYVFRHHYDISNLTQDYRKSKETMKHKRFRQKIVFVKCKKNRQIIIKEEGSKEEDKQEEADVKNKIK